MTVKREGAMFYLKSDLAVADEFHMTKIIPMNYAI